MESIETYAYLWNGSEPGWYVQKTYRSEARIVVSFGPPGASLRDIAALRDVFDDVRSEKPDALLRSLRGCESFTLERTYSRLEAQHLAEAARKRGLDARVASTSHVSYVPCNDVTGATLLIEDPDLARAVGERMEREGAPVRPVEVD